MFIVIHNNCIFCDLKAGFVGTCFLFVQASAGFQETLGDESFMTLYTTRVFWGPQSCIQRANSQSASLIVPQMANSTLVVRLVNVEGLYFLKSTGDSLRNAPLYCRQLPFPFGCIFRLQKIQNLFFIRWPFYIYKKVKVKKKEICFTLKRFFYKFTIPFMFLSYFVSGSFF